MNAANLRSIIYFNDAAQLSVRDYARRMRVKSENI